MRGFLYTFLAIVLLGAITVFVYNHVESPVQVDSSHDQVATSTQQTTTPVNSIGEFEIGLNEVVRVWGVTVNAWAVTEDSRCPANVNCIWAGRVKVAVHIGTGQDMITNELEPGGSVIIEKHIITLQNVFPQQISGHKITDEEYRFVFRIQDRATSYSR